MTKLDIAQEMRVHIKAAIRNKALSEMCYTAQTLSVLLVTL